METCDFCGSEFGELIPAIVLDPKGQVHNLAVCQDCFSRSVENRWMFWGMDNPEDLWGWDDECSCKTNSLR